MTDASFGRRCRTTRPPGAVERAAGIVIPATVEQLVLSAGLFWALSANRAFLGAALKERASSDPSAWGFVAAMLVLVAALNTLLLALAANRWTVKPLIAVMTIVAAAASYGIGAYGAYLDPSMLRNVLHTDLSEARELVSAQLLLHLALYAGLPLLLLWRVRVVARPWLRAACIRAGLLVATVAALAAAVLSVFQPFASLMRNHKELRYLITPANVLWSAAGVAAGDTRGAVRPGQAIGLDAAPGASLAQRRKPLVLVLVVGETARAANWGLNGYARQTTPQLARLPVVNLGTVAACGTNTEVSLPCMFAPVGRRDYDEARIRGPESLLHVAARAGVAVRWRDNQSGCKGVCEGLPYEQVSPLDAPELCHGDRCLDEGLIHDLDQRLVSASGTQLWVLHMLGNHGPSYFRRYPEAFAQFLPDCRQDDLRLCSREQIVNAYDNAITYTDHVLAAAIAKLRARARDVDSALIYVSDHGESLGEQGLFLHGVPYAIAPREQTRVPMIFWASDGFERGAGLSEGCSIPALRRRAAQMPAHDHLFHTVLGLLDIRTAVYEPALDLVGPCKGGSSAPQ